jgi:hypothetical protein
MSEQERLERREKLLQGLHRAFEDMLRRKALLGQTIIITDDEGRPIEVSAKEYLENYVAGN